MFSRRPGVDKAIGLVLDARNSALPYGELERNLQRDLWENLRIRLCVRKA